MAVRNSGELIRAIRDQACWLSGAAGDHDPLLDRIADRPIVMLGSSTLGTEEFFRARAEITRRLILEKGFRTVVLEADFPAVARVDKWIHAGEAREPAMIDDALSGFSRFPRWEWRNREFAEFIGWLARYHASVAEDETVRIYGLDLFSLDQSIESVLGHLHRHWPDEADLAERRYECLRSVSRSPFRYGHGVSLGTRRSCEKEATDQLEALLRLEPSGPEEAEARFEIIQNARVIKNAEAYFRAEYLDGSRTWNLRTKHLFETLMAILERRQKSNHPGHKVVVWAHHSQAGDARATEFVAAGEWSLAQLLRERLGEEAVYSVGFSTYMGLVTAAMSRDGRPERMMLQPAPPESLEGLFHRTGLDRFFIDMKSDPTRRVLDAERLARSIAAVYRPRHEAQTHYYRCVPTRQFDAVYHFDATHSLEPLEAPPRKSEAGPLRGGTNGLL